MRERTGTHVGDDNIVVRGVRTTNGGINNVREIESDGVGKRLGSDVRNCR